MNSVFCKKIPAILLSVVMVFFFNACKGGNAGETSSSASSSAGSSSDFSSSSSEEGTSSSFASSEIASSSADTAQTSSTTKKKPSGNSTSSKSSGQSSTNNTSSEIINIVMPEPGIDGTFQAEYKYFYGVGYVESQMCNRVQVSQAVYLIKSLGVRSVRVWASCMSDSRTLIQWRADRLHELTQELKKSDIQVIFTFYGFESPKKGGLTTWLPRRDTTSGSDYMVMLDNFETMCYTMAKEFPEVDYWEIGNEWNHTGAINPIDWKVDGTGGDPFTLSEKAEITTDLIYRSKRGVRAAGNKGLMIFPAMAPADGMDGIAMTKYLECVYQNIKSGKFGSTNPRDFFEALAWHPYITEAPDMEWVENNNRVYKVACDNGDAGIKVFLTEYGYSDGQNTRADATQAEWLVKGYSLVRKYMPYVETMHYYRMFTDTSTGIDYYGLLNQPEDGFGPKQKGLAFQKMAGGLGNLKKFYMPLYDDED